MIVPGSIPGLSQNEIGFPKLSLTDICSSYVNFVDKSGRVKDLRLNVGGCVPQALTLEQSSTILRPPPEQCVYSTA